MDSGLFPTEISDAELLAYLEGSADEETANRVEQSDEYRQRAEELAEEQAQLVARHFRYTCPDALELGNYYLGYLSAQDVRAIKRHLDHCPHCLYELTTFRTFLGEPERKPTFAQKIKFLVAQSLKEVIGPGTAPEQPFVQRPAFSVRGEAETPITFITEEAPIQVALSAKADANSPEHQVIRGLVTGTPAEPLKVHLWSASEHRDVVSADEHGNFTFKGITPDNYEILIQGTEVVIHIQSFVV